MQENFKQWQSLFLFDRITKAFFICLAALFLFAALDIVFISNAQREIAISYTVMLTGLLFGVIFSRSKWGGNYPNTLFFILGFSLLILPQIWATFGGRVIYNNSSWLLTILGLAVFIPIRPTLHLILQFSTLSYYLLINQENLIIVDPQSDSIWLKIYPIVQLLVVSIIATISTSLYQQLQYADFLKREGLERMNQQLNLAHQEAVLADQVKTKLVVSLNKEMIEREKLIAELDAFAHTVAHDIKTPLASMITCAELLLETYAHLNHSEIIYYLELLNKNGHKLQHIVDSLLFLSFARDGEVALTPLSMPELVEAVLDRLKPLLEQEQAQIILPAEWPAALGHAPWIEEVWMNYASNALKYGGKPPLLHFGYDLQEKGVRFWLKDNGPGLTLQEQQNVFTPFTRLNQAKLEGHGLGLSIVQRVIQKLGGEVGVESSNGQGCLFYFTLPATDGKKEAY